MFGWVIWKLFVNWQTMFRVSFKARQLWNYDWPSYSLTQLSPSVLSFGLNESKCVHLCMYSGVSPIQEQRHLWGGSRGHPRGGHRHHRCAAGTLPPEWEVRHKVGKKSQMRGTKPEEWKIWSGAYWPVWDQGRGAASHLSWTNIFQSNGSLTIVLKVHIAWIYFKAPLKL